MRRSFVFVGSLLIPVLLSIVLAPNVLPAGALCESCHAPGNAGGNYILTKPQMSLSGPSVAPPDTTFVLELSVFSSGKYTVTGLSATLNLIGPGSLPVTENAIKTIGKIKNAGTYKLNWTVEAGSGGNLRANASINYTLHFKHTTTLGNDDFKYHLSRSVPVVIRPVALHLGPTALSFHSGSSGVATFELLAGSNVRNVTACPSSNLGNAVTVSTTKLGNVGLGEKATVSISYSGKKGAINNGRIDVSWQNATGAPDSAYVAVRVTEPAAPVPQSPIPLMGRASGFVSLGLLVGSIVMGYVKMEKRRRVKVHCAISYFVLGLCLYHGAILLLGPYSTVTLGNYILVGYAAASAMGVSSVNGFLLKWWSKKMGYGTWLWIHRIGTVAAITLVLMHGIGIGTDFKFLRNMASGGAE